MKAVFRSAGGWALPGCAGMIMPTLTHAHSAERGLVMLLPTEFAMVGGSAAVLASFFLVMWMPRSLLQKVRDGRLPLWTQKPFSPMIPSLLSWIMLCGLLAAGFLSTHDPLANPLPLTVWTLWWVGFTLVQFVIGNLWPWLNPWYAPYRLVQSLMGRKDAPFTLPPGLGYVPALVLFFGFAWFELVSVAPEDPPGLAVVVGIYWLVTFAGVLLFGYTDWMQRAEAFSIFFCFVGNCSPLLREPVRAEETPASPGRIRICLGWPGQGFLRQEPLPWSGLLFVLLALSSHSFDGLSRTFSWLSLGGINPLEFPGRSAVIGFNTLGLAAAFVVLSALFLAAVLGGRSLAMRPGIMLPARNRMAGQLVYSIVPIAVAFHIAHYLTQLLVNGQYALHALSDPFDRGWNLLGLSPDFQVTTSFLNDLHHVSLIWGFQTCVIVLGHIIGIGLAHFIALDLHAHYRLDERTAIRSQWWLAGLMVGYTTFGLWLLSTASVG